MDTQRYQDLSRRLLRSGVAARHVKRLIAELEAHFADLVAELRSAGLSQAESESQAAARLGTEEALVATILARPELQSWARQRPWLAFVLLPLLALPLQFALSMLSAAGVFAFSTQILGLTALHPGAVHWVVGGLQAYAVWIAPMVAAGAACLLAIRYRAPVAWPVVGSAVIAILGATTNASFEWSAAVPRGALSAGIGLQFPDVGLAKTLRAVVTLLIILVPFLWLRRRAANAEDRAHAG